MKRGDVFNLQTGEYEDRNVHSTLRCLVDFDFDETLQKCDVAWRANTYSPDASAFVAYLVDNKIAEVLDAPVFDIEDRRDSLREEYYWRRHKREVELREQLTKQLHHELYVAVTDSVIQVTLSTVPAAPFIAPSAIDDKPLRFMSFGRLTSYRRGAWQIISGRPLTEDELETAWRESET